MSRSRKCLYFLYRSCAFTRSFSSVRPRCSRFPDYRQKQGRFDAPIPFPVSPDEADVSVDHSIVRRHNQDVQQARDSRKHPWERPNSFARPDSRAKDNGPSSTSSSSSSSSTADGTMTAREKELFNKIFQSILDKKNQPHAARQGKANTITFNDDLVQTLAATPRQEQPDPLTADYESELPQSLQREMSDARILVKNKQEQADSSRARQSPLYLEHKERLFAMNQLSQILHFIEQDLFGPFIRGEIVLERPSTPVLEFCRIYPLLVSDVMCILRLSFKALSLASSVFERMKAIGIESQAIGGSAVVYNELLLTRFEGWHDLGMVEEILKEMEQDAIQADAHTLVILKHIRTTIIHERQATETGRLYWEHVRPKRLETLGRRIMSLNRALNRSSL